MPIGAALRYFVKAVGSGSSETLKGLMIGGGAGLGAGIGMSSTAAIYGATGFGAITMNYVSGVAGGTFFGTAALGHYWGRRGMLWGEHPIWSEAYKNEMDRGIKDDLIPLYKGLAIGGLLTYVPGSPNAILEFLAENALGYAATKPEHDSTTSMGSAGEDCP